jgi:hypothetical protein
MSWVWVRIKIKKGQKMFVCIFCEKIVDVPVCWNCNEYKGIMSYEDAANEYPEIFGYLVEVP